jgi:hypothetical protein
MLTMLVRRSPIRHDEWETMLQSRGEKVSKEFDRWTPGELGRMLKYSAPSGSTSYAAELRELSPPVILDTTSEQRGLSTRGLFHWERDVTVNNMWVSCAHPYVLHSRTKPNSERAWGLLVGGQYCVIDVWFTVGLRNYEYLPTSVSLETVSITDLLERRFKPESIWLELGLDFKSYRVLREAQATAARETDEEFDSELDALRHISKHLGGAISL